MTLQTAPPADVDQQRSSHMVLITYAHINQIKDYKGLVLMLPFFLQRRMCMLRPYDF